MRTARERRLQKTQLEQSLASSNRDAQNLLIKSLPRQARQPLLKICQPVDLRFADVLSEEGLISSAVYFPISGIISLVAPVNGHSGPEIGMVGREGMLGVQTVLGQTRSPVRAIVQGAGTALQVSVPLFRQELLTSPALQRCLQRYAYVSLAQVAASAACLRYHQIAPRLARWLLMSQDRARADSLHVTHEFLAGMLGVRRASVTLAADQLRRTGAISYRRGVIKVLERQALVACACSCYEKDRSRYAEML